MKINGKNAVIATMAIAMAAGIAGSISGTVAWFQYNTRVTSEFTGTTAKCTEFLQVRTKKQTINVKGFATSAPAAGSGYVKGDQYINSSEKKLYTCTADNDGSGKPAFDSGVATVAGAIYKDSASSAFHIYKDSAWTTPVEADYYGEWGTTVDNAAILASAGHANNDFAPITIPATNKAAALGSKYGQPICGYDTYSKWNAALAKDYLEFDLQFRVLDIDGNSTVGDNKRAMFEMPLWLSNVTVAQKAVSGKGDISSAIRVFVSNGTDKHALLAPGATDGADEITTVTHGALDLGGLPGADTKRDIPFSGYSWTKDAAKLLDYGSDQGTQVAYNMGKAANGLYPTDDSKGNLSGGTSLGSTVANPSGTTFAETSYFSLHFVIWLEGWQKLGTDPTPDPATTEYDYFVYEKPANDYGANGDKAVNLADNKLYTKGADAWDNGVEITADKTYTVDGALFSFAGGKWNLADARTIWDADTYIGAQFNIGLSFSVSALDRA